MEGWLGPPSGVQLNRAVRGLMVDEGYGIMLDVARAKKRLDPTPATLRNLYLASGGVCAMPSCDKRLNKANGAWIGTVAHIVAAEDNGPRADPSMSPEDKRAFSNLILLCADHGRLIDGRDTGERDFPRRKLEEIKRIHEQRFSGLVDQMVKSARPKARSVNDFFDTSIGHSVPGGSCHRFVAYWDFRPELVTKAQQELRESRRLLKGLSLAALGTLAALLELWESTRRSTDLGDQRWTTYVTVHGSLVYNRVLNQRQLGSAIAELQQKRLVEPPDLTDSMEYYTVYCPWTDELTGWRMLADYLYGTQDLTVSSWVKTLDYTVFD
jgi:hypothetical protein